MPDGNGEFPEGISVAKEEATSISRLLVYGAQRQVHEALRLSEAPSSNDPPPHQAESAPGTAPAEGTRDGPRVPPLAAVPGRGVQPKVVLADRTVPPRVGNGLVEPAHSPTHAGGPGATPQRARYPRKRDVDADAARSPRRGGGQCGVAGCVDRWRRPP